MPQDKSLQKSPDRADSAEEAQRSESGLPQHVLEFLNDRVGRGREFSREEIGEVVGRDANGMGKFLRGEQTPSTMQLAAMASYMGFSLDNLFGVRAKPAAEMIADNFTVSEEERQLVELVRVLKVPAKTAIAAVFQAGADLSTSLVESVDSAERGGRRPSAEIPMIPGPSKAPKAKRNRKGS